MKDFMVHLPEVLRLLRDAVRAYQDSIVLRRKELELKVTDQDLRRQHNEVQLKKLEFYSSDRYLRNRH